MTTWKDKWVASTTRNWCSTKQPIILQPIIVTINNEWAAPIITFEERCKYPRLSRCKPITIAHSVTCIIGASTLLPFACLGNLYFNIRVKYGHCLWYFCARSSFSNISDWKSFFKSSRGVVLITVVFFCFWKSSSLLDDFLTFGL